MDTYLNHCQVCSGVPVLVMEKGQYVCPQCKAVYYPSGVRNMSYPCIYDKGEVRGVEVVVNKFTDGGATARLFVRGLKVGDVMRVRNSRTGDWEYANAVDMDGSTLLAKIGGRIKRYDFTNWCVGTSEQPIPVSATPDPKNLHKVISLSKKQAKLMTAAIEAVEEPQLTLWTLTGPEEDIAVGVKVPVASTRTTCIGGLKCGPVTVILIQNPISKMYHLFHKDSGGSLAFGRTSKHALHQARTFLKELTKRAMTRITERAVNAAAKVQLVSEKEFFGGLFQ